MVRMRAAGGRDRAPALHAQSGPASALPRGSGTPLHFNPTSCFCGGRASCRCVGAVAGSGECVCVCVPVCVSSRAGGTPCACADKPFVLCTIVQSTITLCTMCHICTSTYILLVMCTVSFRLLLYQLQTRELCSACHVYTTLLDIFFYSHILFPFY